jgi:hypothetical protein
LHLKAFQTLLLLGLEAHIEGGTLLDVYDYSFQVSKVSALIGSPNLNAFATAKKGYEQELGVDSAKALAAASELASLTEPPDIGELRR